MSSRSILSAVALLAVVGSASQAQTTLVYDNDFSLNALGWSSLYGVSLIQPPGDCSAGPLYCGQNVLGSGFAGGQPFGLETATLSLASLAPHTVVGLKFQLFVASSWDGNAGGVGPDYFRVFADLNPIIRTTFSNVGGNPNQCFPVLMCNADVNNPLQTGANPGTPGNLGGAWNFLGSAVYDINVTFAHSGSTLFLDFQDTGTQAWTDEGWAIDKVSVLTDAELTATPEPGSIVLLATGLLGAFGMAHRRRSRDPERGEA